MSTGYTWVQWSRHKRVYDGIVAAAAVLYVAAYVGITRWRWPAPEAVSDVILIMRALGSCAIVLLTMILCIGPLARMDRRFLPVLYNRRHLGVVTFLIALGHAVIALAFYHGGGAINPLLSLLAINTGFASVRAFPFQILGLGALVIMFLMAATSHDFWLKNLSARAWKRLHMLVYPAYVLLVGHVALGALQNERGVLAPAALSAGVGVVMVLHVVAGFREVRADRGSRVETDAEGAWIDAGPAERIPADRARMVCGAGGERIAVFKHGGKISAVTNVCAHQGGPLSEGKIIDGCITCPWHGWQYKPGDGCSPPPFEEKIATYRVRIVKGNVQVNARALPPGTPVEPAVWREAGDV